MLLPEEPKLIIFQYWTDSKESHFFQHLWCFIVAWFFESMSCSDYQGCFHLKFSSSDATKEENKETCDVDLAVLVSASENLQSQWEGKEKNLPRTMSVTPSNLSLNGTSFFAENHSIMDKPSKQRTLNVLLFCLTFIIAFIALLGSIYSLVSLLKMQNKTTVSMIVTSLSVDDLISIVPVIIFMLTQWSSDVLPQPLCTISALAYLCQGVSGNLKGSLIVSYNFYTINRTETTSCSTPKRRVSMVWAILIVWIVSLLICILPLCGWGKYIPTSWGCFTDTASSYVLFLFVVYLLCFCLLTVLSVPLTYQLLCSDEQQLLHIDYQEISGGCITPGTPAGCSTATPSLSPVDPVDKTLKHFQNACPGSEAVFRKGVAESSALEPGCVNSIQSRSFTVGFAQKRFSLILALTKVVLWLPMMVNCQIALLSNVYWHLNGM